MEETTRRDFMKKVSVGAIGAALVGAGFKPSQAEASQPTTFPGKNEVLSSPELSPTPATPILEDGKVTSTIPGSKYGIYNIATGKLVPLSEHLQTAGPLQVGMEFKDEGIPENVVLLSPEFYDDKASKAEIKRVKSELFDLLEQGDVSKDAFFVIVVPQEENKVAFWMGTQRHSPFIEQSNGKPYTIPFEYYKEKDIRIAPLDIDIRSNKYGNLLVNGARDNEDDSEPGSYNGSNQFKLGMGENVNGTIMVNLANSTDNWGNPETPFYLGANGLMIMPSNGSVEINLLQQGAKLTPSLEGYTAIQVSPETVKRYISLSVPKGDQAKTVGEVIGISPEDIRSDNMTLYTRAKQQQQDEKERTGSGQSESGPHYESFLTGFPVPPDGAALLFPPSKLLIDTVGGKNSDFNNHLGLG